MRNKTYLIIDGYYVFNWLVSFDKNNGNIDKKSFIVGLILH